MLAASAVKPLTASNPAMTRKDRRTGSGGALPKGSAESMCITRQSLAQSTTPSESLLGALLVKSSLDLLVRERSRDSGHTLGYKRVKASKAVSCSMNLLSVFR